MVAQIETKQTKRKCKKSHRGKGEENAGKRSLKKMKTLKKKRWPENNGYPPRGSEKILDPTP